MFTRKIICLKRAKESRIGQIQTKKVLLQTVTFASFTTQAKESHPNPFTEICVVVDGRIATVCSSIDEANFLHSRRREAIF